MLLTAAAVALFALESDARQAAAQDYSIYSKVMRLGDPLPLASSLTLFQNGVGYDFPSGGNGEIIVIDPQNSRILLIDPRAGVKQQAMVTMPTLGSFVEEYRKQGMENKNPAVRAMFDPQLKVQQNGDTVVAGNSTISYEVRGVKPPQKEIAATYLRFLNWSARLNATNSGSMPPFARITLNVELEKRGLIPQEVKRTIQRGGKKHSLRSTHQAAWSLTAAEKKKISEVRQMMKDLPVTPFLNLRAAQRVATNPKMGNNRK